MKLLKIFNDFAKWINFTFLYNFRRNRENINKDKCLFCREKILEGASICYHCGKEQLDDEEIDKLIFLNAFLSSPKIFSLIIVIIGTYIHGFIGGLCLFSYLGFWAYRIRKVKEKYIKRDESGSGYILLSKIKKDNKRHKHKFVNFMKFVLIIFLILIILNMTNPTIKDFIEYIEAKNLKLKNLEESADFLFYSFFVVDLERSKEKRQYFLGIFNRVYKLDTEYGKKELEKIQRSKNKKKNEKN